MTVYILDSNGEPEVCHNVLEWSLWFSVSLKQRRVAYDEFDGGHVSTVFLGLDHGLLQGGNILWETMVFGGPHDGYQKRYGTRADAEAGHRAVLREVQPE